MKRRFSLFTYPMMDMKAAEAELNRRAAAGHPGRRGSLRAARSLILPGRS